MFGWAGRIIRVDLTEDRVNVEPLDPDFARKWGVDPDDSRSLKDKRVIGAVINRITTLLSGFPGYAKIRRVHLSLEPWSIDNGLLTPTMKIKRNKVLEYLKEEVAHLYRDGR